MTHQSKLLAWLGAFRRCDDRSPATALPSRHYADRRTASVQTFRDISAFVHVRGPCFFAGETPGLSTTPGVHQPRITLRETASSMVGGVLSSRGAR